MLFYQRCLIIIVGMNSFDKIVNRLNWTNNSTHLYTSFIHLLISVLIQLWFIYRFPILFVSWLVITDPYLHKLIINNYKGGEKKDVAKKDVAKKDGIMDK